MEDFLLQKIDKRFKHGQTYTKLYEQWSHINKRCNNKNDDSFKNYGGKKDNPTKNKFENFLAFKEYLENVLGPAPEGHTLDRINVNGHYEPGNLRWASWSEQNLNRRLLADKSSQYRGVYWNKNRNKWQANIGINAKMKYLGSFKNELDAAQAFLEKYYNHYKQWPPEYKPMPIKFKEIL